MPRVSKVPSYRYSHPTEPLYRVRMAERPLSNQPSGDTLAFMANLATTDGFIEPPTSHVGDSLRDSYLNTTPNDSGTLLATKPENYAEDPILSTPTTPPKSKRRRVILVVLLLFALIVIIVAVIVPVYFTVIKPQFHESTKKKSSGGGSGGSTPASSGGPTPFSGSSNAISGGDGSTVYTANGTTFIYKNSFGGVCKCFTACILYPT